MRPKEMFARYALLPLVLLSSSCASGINPSPSETPTPTAPIYTPLQLQTGTLCKTLQQQRRQIYVQGFFQQSGVGPGQPTQTGDLEKYIGAPYPNRITLQTVASADFTAYIGQDITVLANPVYDPRSANPQSGYATCSLVEAQVPQTVYVTRRQKDRTPFYQKKISRNMRRERPRQLV